VALQVGWLASASIARRKNIFSTILLTTEEAQTKSAQLCSAVYSFPIGKYADVNDTQAVISVGQLYQSSVGFAINILIKKPNAITL